MILCVQDFAFSDGNAGSNDTGFYYSLNNLDKIPWDVIRSHRWNDFEDGKRKRNAEFLIHPNIPVDRFWRIAVNNEDVKDPEYEKTIKDLNNLESYLLIAAGVSLYFDLNNK